MIHKVTARYDDGTFEIRYGEHSPELTEKFEVKAVFFLTDEKGQREPVWITDTVNKNISIRVFDSFAINILDEVRLVNVTNNDVYESNFGRAVDVEPPVPLPRSKTAA